MKEDQMVEPESIASRARRRCHHLIKITKRNIADFDFRLKEEATKEL